MPNIELLTQVLHWVEGEDEKRQRGKPSEWDQKRWLCETTCCFAGMVCIASVGRGAITHYENLDCGVIRLNGLTVREYATSVLGLSSIQRDFLFDANNTALDIRRVCEEIAGHSLPTRPQQTKPLPFTIVVFPVKDVGALPVGV